MQSLKIIVLTAVSLVLFDSWGSAEVVMMSLQEAMRRPDAVVVGTVEESHRTDVTDANMDRQLPQLNEEHWIATCRVERYIKGPKTYNPDSEEAKSASIIYIAFSYRVQTPARIKLMEGRRYLLFLKEIESQKAGERLYEMITPYHGAIDPGQTHNLYDEKNPSARLSFEEIVRRITPQDSVLPQPTEQDVITQPIVLTIQSDKQVYATGEEIGLTLEFKNSGTQNLWLFTKMLPNIDLRLSLYKLNGENKKNISPPVLIGYLRQIVDADFKELPPQGTFSKQMTLKDFSKDLILEEGSYEIEISMWFDWSSDQLLKIVPWEGSVQSNTTKFEVKEKADLSANELRMKERLVALSRGEGDAADLRIELMDGNPMTLTGMRIYNIADGKVVSQEWASIGSPEKRGERAVTDEEIRQLLETLIEHQYWTFQGTQFIPDAPGFMFRFYYKDLQPIEYRCDAHEYEPSTQLSAIRSVWLGFVSGASPQDKASCEAQGGRWGRFGLMIKEPCNRPTTDVGKTCSDHNECESDCVTDDAVPAGTEVTGKCFEWTVMLGRCFNGVKDGKAQGMICVD